MRWNLGVLAVVVMMSSSARASEPLPVLWSCGGDVWGKEMCAEIGAQMKASGRIRFMSEPDWPAIVVVCSFGADGPRERERLFGTCSNDVYVARGQKERPQKTRQLKYSRHDGEKAGRVELQIVESLAAKYFK